MKRNHAIRIVSGLVVIFAVECQAQFNGTDDFNDNVKDSARWGIDFSQGGGLFTEYYDANGPSGGYTWTLLASTNISTAWGMTSTNIFSVWVFGRVQETTRAVTSADNLFGDNFYASSVSGTSSAPRLLINSAGGT